MKKTTEPFKAICHLADGRINSADGLLFFDAILYHAWFLKYEPDVLNGLKKADKHYDMGLPLTKLQDGRYAASCGFYYQYNQKIEHWNKRPDFTNGINSPYLEMKGKIDTSAGQFKAYHFPQVIRTISDIEFYGTGTIEKIKDLLSYIPAVGKKPSAGWGLVREWEIEPFPEEWHTYGAYGLMRPMPVETIHIDVDYRIMVCQLKPPYWKQYAAGLCYMPEPVINATIRKAEVTHV